MAASSNMGTDPESLLAQDVGKGCREAFKDSRTDEVLAKFGMVRFSWNNRFCWGTDFHKDVLDNKHERVLRQLDQGQAHLEDRFAYTTTFNGKAQICTGMAIHLAASRGHTLLVETLLDRRASVESKLCRDEADTYDVIHAAVFKEGRGGSSDIITLLCSRGANIDSANANMPSCLHLAFQTGNMATIRAVRHARKMRSLADEIRELEEGEVDFDSKEHKATPLELGIQWGKMNKEALAKAAPPHISSLKVFIHRAPECIPMFMSRLRDTNRMGCRNEELSKRLADELTHKDIARLLRDCPEAAVALLNGVTAKPIVASEGWHPLPSRVSFAARSPIVRLLKSFFPTRRFLCFYETECSWSYDDHAYEAPAWHSKITDVKEPPCVDASIQVCYIPNIVSANSFAALVSCTGGEDPALFLYDSVAVRAAVSYTFWNGAIWVDVLQFLISFWGLTLLVLETCFKHEAAVGKKMDYLDWQMNEGVFQPSFVAQSDRNGVVADWIIAKGMVDLLLEVAQFCGCCVIGEVSSYLNLGNVWDLSRSIIPIMLLFFHDSRFLHLLIVLIYWMRLLEGVTYSEKIGHALLPLQKLATGLLPAMTFTLVGFCALTHSMYAVQVEANHLWPDTLFDTFTTLITQGLPEKPPDDILELLVLYGGELFFSVFVLNIFIGVIGEQYSKEKDQVGLMFISVRASSCLTYLLRIHVFPCNLVTSTTAAIVGGVCVFSTLTLQVLALFFGRQLPGLLQLLAFVACQVITFIAAIQCKGSDFPWMYRTWCQSQASSTSESADSSGYVPLGTRNGAGKRRYLWICEPRDLEIMHPVTHPNGGKGSSAPSRASQSMIFDDADKMLRSSIGGLEDLGRYELALMIHGAVREELEDAKDLLERGTRSRRNTSPMPTLLASTPLAAADVRKADGDEMAALGGFVSVAPAFPQNIMSRSQGMRARPGAVVLGTAALLVATKLVDVGCFIPPAAPGLRQSETGQNLRTSGLAGLSLLPTVAHAEEGTPESESANALVEKWRAFSENPDQFDPTAVSNASGETWKLGTLTGRADQETVFLIVGAVGFAAAFIVKFILPDPKDEPVDIEAAKARPRPEWVIQRDLKEAEEMKKSKEFKERQRGRGMREGIMPR
ncbi:unnamed protein product [Symbiodinium microadriaticum]|nr:unnamed protein product [Symbiodinium microadriaticum]CAE7908807.1 unnamed protein product [Symbiodinium sp. KB8]